MDGISIWLQPLYCTTDCKRPLHQCEDTSNSHLWEKSNLFPDTVVCLECISRRLTFALSNYFYLFKSHPVQNGRK